MEINEHGVFVDPIEIDYSVKKASGSNGSANVRIGCKDDLYYNSYSYHLSLQGQGAAPGIGKYRKSYKTQQEAIDEATERLKARLTEVVNGQHQSSTDKDLAKQIIQNIDGSRQLTLF